MIWAPFTSTSSAITIIPRDELFLNLLCTYCIPEYTVKYMYWTKAVIKYCQCCWLLIVTQHCCWQSQWYKFTPIPIRIQLFQASLNPIRFIYLLDYFCDTRKKRTFFDLEIVYTWITGMAWIIPFQIIMQCHSAAYNFHGIIDSTALVIVLLQFCT